MTNISTIPAKRQDRRMVRLSDEDIARIIDGVTARIFTHHDSHHEFIQELVEARRMRRERWEAIRRQVAGWMIIAFLSAIGTAVYKAGAYMIQSGRPH